MILQQTSELSVSTIMDSDSNSEWSIYYECERSESSDDMSVETAQHFPEDDDEPPSDSHHHYGFGMTDIVQMTKKVRREHPLNTKQRTIKELMVAFGFDRSEATAEYKRLKEQGRALMNGSALHRRKRGKAARPSNQTMRKPNRSSSEEDERCIPMITDEFDDLMEVDSSATVFFLDSYTIE